MELYAFQNFLKLMLHLFIILKFLRILYDTKLISAENENFEQRQLQHKKYFITRASIQCICKSIKISHPLL